MELGQLYRSAAVLGAGGELPPALRPEQWAGQPGTRAPHLWVSKGGEQLSTLDFLQRDWVLLTGDQRWCVAAATAGERLGFKLQALRIGSDLTPPVPVPAADATPSDPEAFRKEFRMALGIGPAGASLIRPDAFVAWRSTDLPTDPAGAVADALARVSSACPDVQPCV